MTPRCSRLSGAGLEVDAIYEALVLDDIATTADLLRPIYDRTQGRDGYISVEVRPKLAHDTAGTVAEARRLFATLARPNVMIKVPATAEGIPAIATLIGEGINVNVTLIFSLESYQAVAQAYLAGLEKRVATGGDLSRVASVASFFVSRVDSAVDRQLEALIRTGRSDLKPLLGRAAIANTRFSLRALQRTLRQPALCGAAGKGRSGTASAVGQYRREESALSRCGVR